MGYVPVSGFVRADALELLDLAGRVSHFPLSEIKMMCFVRDFNTADAVSPERLTRKTFPARPRVEGLWLRCTLQDDDVFEGLAPLDLSLAEGLAEDKGIQMTPPDVRGNVQRIYLPRLAMKSLDVLGVVTNPSKKRITPPAEEQQPDLFAELGPDSRPN